LRILLGKETEGFSPKTAAIFTNRSVRRGSPKSAAPKVSTAHSSAFSSSLTFMTRSPLLIHAPFFTNALTCVEVSALLIVQVYELSVFSVDLCIGICVSGVNDCYGWM